MLKKSAVNNLSIYSLEYLTREDSKRFAAEAQDDKMSALSRTEAGFISLDAIPYSGCPDTGLGCTEKICHFM